MEAVHFILCFITLSFLTYHIESNSPAGFSTHLIHRNSPFSSHYNPSNTHYHNVRDSVQRARARSARILAPKLSKSSAPSLQEPVTAEPGDYDMKVSLGTPPLDFELIADTGSDLVWTQCKPCISCYKQDDQLFNPEKSSTYKKQSCHSIACKEVPETSCDKVTDICQYQEVYGDGSQSSGDLSSESFTFESTSGSPVVIPKIVFGCGHNNTGNFGTYFDGIVGLGDGKVSLVNQLSEKHFSYCLVPLSANVTSTINFGAKGVVSGPGVQTTPFYKQHSDTFYYLNLQNVSVNGKKFKINTKKHTDDDGGAHEGNTIIDSGTTLTILPTELYNEVQHAFEKSISAKPIKTEDGLLCYKKGELKLKEVPMVTFHFEGADIDLGALNTMTAEIEEGLICLSIVESSSPLFSLFGNNQQMDFLIGYDLEKKTVSFKKVDCSKHH